MDLTKKIGQLFILGFQGETLTSLHPIHEDLRHRNLGGVILFDRLLAKKLDHNNIVSTSQVRKLTLDLQEVAGGRLFIGIDQEGGKVCRLSQRRGFSPTPAAAELGAHHDESVTSQQSEETAKLLKNLGINNNFAPVVDINIYRNNPIIGRLGRSFSHDADTVVQHARAWITSHKKHGILSCLKHFPGHGSSREDSHLGFVDISETWQLMELQPFKKLIKTQDVDAIMTGHLFISQLDNLRPATLSEKIIGQLLRKDLGFKGVVISDDLQMKAITDNYGLEEAIVSALAAGIDMIIIGNNLSYDEKILSKAIDAVLQAVEKGILTKEMIGLAFQRVQTLKDKYLQKDESWQPHQSKTHIPS